MERGGSITRVMAEGGIFIVRARAVFPGPQWADVYYAWAEDEDPRIGLHSKGEANHIGVASTLGQLELRAAAMAMLGDVTYAFLADLPARNGFSGSCRRTWKCNAFVADVAITAGLTVPVQHRLSHLLSPDGLYPLARAGLCRGTSGIGRVWARGHRGFRRRGCRRRAYGSQSEMRLVSRRHVGIQRLCGNRRGFA